MLAACYGGWVLAVFGLSAVWLPLAMLGATVTAALHSSLQHEALHGHPTRHRWLNEVLVFPTLSLMIPYGRFRDSHLAHHTDETLTDPYDDPETNYLDPVVWARLPGWVQSVLRVNNTLLGRILLGPLVSQVVFMRADWRAIQEGDKNVLRSWLVHLPALALVLSLVRASPMPLWAYLIAAYCANGLLKIRTYLEHRAHSQPSGRTVIIEDRGPLALLFLNNNLHVVHHRHPGVAWYHLPKLYRTQRDAFRAMNDDYCYENYGRIFARHLLRAKDPVPHPLWPLDAEASQGSMKGQRESTDAPASDHRDRGFHPV